VEQTTTRTAADRAADHSKRTWGLFQLSTDTVLDWFEDGKLPGYRLGGKKGGPVRFRVSEIEHLLEGWRVPGAELAVREA
jgi:hypothetical protein